MINNNNRIKFLILFLVAAPVLPACNYIIISKKDPKDSNVSTESLEKTITRILKTVTSLSSATSATLTTGTYTLSSGSEYKSFTVDLGSGFQAGNLCNSLTLFGLTGTASCAQAGSTTVVTLSSLLKSNAARDISSTQITQATEAATAPSSSLGTGYRDTSDSLIDDDGAYWAGYCASSTATTQAACVTLGGTFSWMSSICVETGAGFQNSTNCTGGTRAWMSNGSTCTNLTPGADTTSCSTSYQISSATHAAFSNCGGPSYLNLAASIANCATVNGAQATWNGAVLGGHGEGSWVLVARLAANSEVWQDQRTGLIWSSKAGGTAAWCKATGSVQAPLNGGTSCSGTTISFCAENTGMSPGFAGDTGGSWQLGGRTYDNAKGGMGLQSTLPVKWRLPTKNDYMQAEVDGIRYVMPDMGGTALGLNEWSASVYAPTRSDAWTFSSAIGRILQYTRTNSYNIRCVGRAH